MKKQIKLIIVFMGALLAGGAWHYVHKTDQTIQQARSDVQLREFDYDRDQAFIKHLFADNWYWLIAGDEYDVDYMLRNRSSSKNPPRHGNLTLKTLYTVDDQPAGFLAYYKESFYAGRILFVCIEKEFRSRGYAKYMFQSAVDDLRCKGVVRIRVTTRTENYPAQKVYSSSGFEEVKRNSVFVHYQITF